MRSPRNPVRFTTFTLFLVVISALQVIAAGLTYGSARKATALAKHSATIALAQKRVGDRSLKQMEVQAAIEKQSAEAAALSAHVADQTMRLTQRSMIVVDQIDYRPDGPLDEYTIVGCTLRNVGPTIASDMRYRWGFWAVNGDKDAFGTWRNVTDRLSKGLSYGPFALAPNQTMRVNRDKAVSRILTPDIVNSAFTGRTLVGYSAVLHFGLEGTYRDVFGQTHLIRVCYWFNRDAGQFVLATNEST